MSNPALFLIKVHLIWSLPLFTFSLSHDYRNVYWEGPYNMLFTREMVKGIQMENLTYTRLKGTKIGTFKYKGSLHLKKKINLLCIALQAWTRVTEKKILGSIFYLSIMMSLLMTNGSTLQSGKVTAARASESTSMRNGDGSEIFKALSSTQCVWQFFALEEAISDLAIYFYNFIKKSKIYYFPRSTHSVIGVSVIQ